jgi:2-polyprenyl-6-methoxyphenol hydroxylase-like FAD-dependent oxidoreductase
MTGMNIHHNGRSILYPFAGKLSAANIERKDLDPALKASLTKYANITLLTGCRVSSLIKSDNHVTGIQYVSSTNENIRLTAKVVIGSDGRNSEVIKLSKARFKKTDNQRVALFSYFSTKTIINESHVWALRQGQEYIGLFPNKQRVLISWYLPRNEFESKTETHEQSFDRHLAYINKQGIHVGERLENIIVVKDSSPQIATTYAKSLALIGDSKLAADPLTGIGCTWAMQSANLLATCLGPAPSHKNNSRINNMQIRLFVYNFIHNLTFKLSSALMTFVSMHGKWVFNSPVYRCLAWLTRKNEKNKNQ